MKKQYLTSLGLVLLMINCASDSPDNSTGYTPVPDPEPTETYTYEMPDTTLDGWETDYANLHGIDTDKLEDIIDARMGGRWLKMHSISMARNGKLIFDEYFKGEDRYNRVVGGSSNPNRDESTLHVVQSSSKSMVAVAFGAAMLKGLNVDPEEYISNVFLDMPLDWNSVGDEYYLTILQFKHLLSMTAGFDWEDYKDVAKQMQDPHPIQLVLSYPFNYATPPGSSFLYNSGLPDVVAEYLTRASGMDFVELMNTYIFEPMQIDDSYIYPFPGNQTKYVAHGGIWLRPRDLLKFQQLYLNGGVWNGNRVVTEEWVEDCVKVHSDPKFNPSVKYGYFWWLDTFDYNGHEIKSWRTEGMGGQRSWCFPDLNLCIAFTGGYYDDNDYNFTQEILKEYIFPSIAELN